jgi:hypothetical protein
MDREFSNRNITSGVVVVGKYDVLLNNRVVSISVFVEIDRCGLGDPTVLIAILCTKLGIN